MFKVRTEPRFFIVGTWDNETEPVETIVQPCSDRDFVDPKMGGREDRYTKHGSNKHVKHSVEKAAKKQEHDFPKQPKT